MQSMHHQVLMMESSLKATALQYNYMGQNKLPPFSNNFYHRHSSKFTNFKFFESKITALHNNGVTALQGSANRLNDINAAVGEKAYDVVTMIAELFGGYILFCCMNAYYLEIIQ